MLEYTVTGIAPFTLSARILSMVLRGCPWTVVAWCCRVLVLSVTLGLNFRLGDSKSSLRRPQRHISAKISTYPDS